MVAVMAVVVIGKYLHSRQPHQRQVLLPSDSIVQSTTNEIFNNRTIQESSSAFSIVNTSQWAQPSGSYQIDSSDLWEEDANDSKTQVKLPMWMKQYFRWHKEKINARRQRLRGKRDSKNTSSLENMDDDDFRVLYVTCLASYRKCGGAADRLLSIPFFLKIAAQSHRVLLIQWTKPASLEEFLVPPQHGMEWRVAAAVTSTDHPTPFLSGYKAGTQDTILESMHASNVTILQVKFQAHDHGSVYYDSFRESENEPNFQTIFHVVWKIFFTPSPPLAASIQETLSRFKLTPKRYVAAHVRALYNTKQRSPDLVKTWSIHAIQCALLTLISNKMPPIIYFASDSEYAVQIAMQYSLSTGIPIHARAPSATGTNPLHLDKTKDWRQRPASDFYDLFVDLYLLGLGSCVTYGMGGYGYFASLISHNPHCSLVHMTATSITECPLDAINRNKTTSSWISSQLHDDEVPQQLERLFLPPMLLPNVVPVNDGRTMMAQQTRGVLLKENRRHDRVNKQTDLEMQLLSTTNHKQREKQLPNINGANTDKLPVWMKTYFQWHQKQRRLLTSSNWRDFRYIIMSCLEADLKCGGTADRLRPTPFVLRVAAETRRLFFIKWEKPAALEHFLLPPQSVVVLDWRTPDFINFGEEGGPKVNSISLLVQQAKGNQTVIKAQIQSNDHGSHYYNKKAIMNTDEDEGVNAFREHYHDCWYSLFTPTFLLARTIELVMEQLNLIPGEYAVAHLRALYGIEDMGRDLEYVKRWTRNAINCVSGLRPGGPFFFASDSLYAKKIAIQYGAEHNVSVVSVIDDKEPLHLDLAEDWKTRSPSEYFPIFVDLYIMSFGSCFSYNVGGFAKWAQLISGRNFSCNLRHWTNGVSKRTANKSGCDWTDPSKSMPNKITVRTTAKLPVFTPPIDG
jgi:hypothetical protein